MAAKNIKPNPNQQIIRI